ncbi:MAG: hypothetical protein OEY74_12225 [Gammaproteobacteria bacterium]|nr:hypothetical protein [Gammaproteobacteria bacterium]
MDLKNNGINVDCGRCEYTSNDGHESFEVVVPLSDAETGTDGIATLLCSVSAGRHDVKLKQWRDAQGNLIQPSAEIQQRLLAALERLADQQMCGNYQICPADVVRIVEELSRR